MSYGLNLRRRLRIKFRCGNRHGGDAMITRRRFLYGTNGLAALATAGLSGAETPAPNISSKERSGTMEIKRSGSRASGKGPWQKAGFWW
jgi:hypothetical protein